MELRQLRYFSKACELQNFSEAAKVLYISQSTLSQQIKQLEEELDVLLFDRIGKRVVTTEAGLAFLPYALKTIQEAESGRQVIKDLKDIEAGTLLIGVTHSMSRLLTTALQQFTKRYPKIMVKATFVTSEEAMSMLEANEIDMALSFKTEELSNNFETHPLFYSRLCFMVHKSHPMADLSSITLKRLSRTPLVLPDIGFATRKKVDEMFRDNGLNPRVGVEMNDVHAIVQMLESGYWGTVLTQAAVQEEPDIVEIPIISSEQLISRGYLFWSQGTYRKKSALAFADILRKVAEIIIP